MNAAAKLASIPKSFKGPVSSQVLEDYQRVLLEWDTFTFTRLRGLNSSRRGPRYRWLNAEKAHKVVDFLQILLDDTHDFEHGSINCKKHLGILRYLSRIFEVLPISLIIYQVQRLGSNPVAGGGFADIWRGSFAGKPVCLKVLRFAIEQDDKTRVGIRSRFCREALLWRQLKHPNVLPLLGINMELFAPSFCLISPWMENRDIITYLKQHPQHDLSCVIYEVAAGLRYLHTRDPPFIHGDLRGGNILVTDDGHCCLADFGLTLVKPSSQAWSITVSSSSTINGTLRWLAPEYIIGVSGSVPNHPSRDVYAFGCTVYEILTRRPPFHEYNNDVSVLWHLMAGGRPNRPQNLAQWFPDRIWALVTRCWAQDAQARPSTDEICRDLRESLQLAWCSCHELIQCPDGGVAAADSSDWPGGHHLGEYTSRKLDGDQRSLMGARTTGRPRVPNVSRENPQAGDGLQRKRGKFYIGSQSSSDAEFSTSSQARSSVPASGECNPSVASPGSYKMHLQGDISSTSTNNPHRQSTALPITSNSATYIARPRQAERGFLHASSSSAVYAVARGSHIKRVVFEDDKDTSGGETDLDGDSGGDKGGDIDAEKGESIDASEYKGWINAGDYGSSSIISGAATKMSSAPSPLPLPRLRLYNFSKQIKALKYKSEPNVPSLASRTTQQQSSRPQPLPTKPSPSGQMLIEPWQIAKRGQDLKRCEELDRHRKVDKEFFTKVPRRIYSDPSRRSRSGLLSQMMNAGSGVYPGKRGYSSGDIALHCVGGGQNSVTRLGIRQTKSISHQEVRSQLSAAAPSRVPSSGSNAGQVGVADAGGLLFFSSVLLKPTKSTAALPVIDSAIATSKTNIHSRGTVGNNFAAAKLHTTFVLKK